ncbi:MAG: TldD/PmbA family protein [Candidatus Aminicenantales bacterium]
MKKAISPLSLPFEDHFHFSPVKLQKILNTALSGGGDFAEIYLEYRSYNFITMEEDIIKETAESLILGMGIRVLCGEMTGYGYTNDFSPEKIKKAAFSAAAIASSGAHRREYRLKPTGFIHNFYPVRRPAHKAGLEKKINLVKEAYLACQKFSPAVKKVKVSLQDHIQYVTIVNSEGLMVSDARPLIKLVCVAIAEKKNKREFGFSGGGGRVGLEYFRDGFIPAQIGKEAAQEAVSLLEARPAPAGEMPVVLAPGHAGVLIHEATGHLLEADSNRKKTSIFWDKLGQKVASDRVTIYDDPTIPYFRGSYNIDDEGTVPQKTLLIHKGIVRGFLQDRLSARLMKMPLTGHGRRQGYASIPIPRMANTYIEKGEYDPEEIIKSVRKGFYADKFQGGQVEDSGKFTFSVSSGFLINNGKLTVPVKQATLIGTNIDILHKIEMIGSDLKFSLQTGTCGKEGQEVPVTDGCPTIKISSMTVGGLQ